MLAWPAFFKHLERICQSRGQEGGGVSGLFIFIATNRLKPGKLADERERVPGLVDFVEANEPRVIASHGAA